MLANSTLQDTRLLVEFVMMLLIRVGTVQVFHVLPQISQETYCYRKSCENVPLFYDNLPPPSYLMK